MLLNGGELDGVRLLRRETIQMMRTNQLPDDLVPFHFGDGPWPGVGYGLGFGVIVDPAQSEFFGSEGTFGWIGLSGCAFWADPREELILLSIPQAWCYWKAGHALSNLAYQTIVD
jgi:CubicO group peptidase (beta-lactamase class C family)